MADKLSDLIKRASVAAEAAPENLREAAFNKAFEALMAADGEATQTRKPRARGRGPVKAAGTARSDASDANLDQLDRTAHPDIQHNDTSLNNSLRLLRAARDELDIDGLTAATVARVLRDKFRCRITRQAVSLALNGAGRYVNRHNEGKEVIFRIMGPGEDYVDGLAAQTSGSAAPKRSRANKRGKAKATPDASPPKKTKSGPKQTRIAKADKATSGKKNGGQRSVSPAAALKQIHAAGFFSTPRTIGAIIDHLKHQHGRTFQAFEMSTPLVRMLRAGGLTREKNKDNQYEYQQP